MKDKASSDIAGIYNFVDDIEQLHREIRSALREIGTRSAAGAGAMFLAGTLLHFLLSRL